MWSFISSKKVGNNPIHLMLLDQYTDLKIVLMCNIIFVWDKKYD